MRRAAIAFVALALAFAPAHADPVKRRKAIVIGINKTWRATTDLGSAEESARKVAVFLKAHGFDVVPLIGGVDATRPKVTKALQDWTGAKSSPDGEYIFYYAGHGDDVTLGPAQEVDGYFFLTDCDPDNWVGTCLSFDTLAGISRASHARVIYFMIDACYTGAMDLVAAGNVRSPSDSDAHAQRGRHALLGGSPNEASYYDRDPGGLNMGIFTHFALEAMVDRTLDKDGSGYISINEWFPDAAKKTQDYVQARVNAQQLPHRVDYVNGLEGEIDFAQTLALAAPAPSRTELVFAANASRVIDTDTTLAADRIVFEEGARIQVRNGAKVQFISPAIEVKGHAQILGIGNAGVDGIAGSPLPQLERRARTLPEFFDAANDCMSNPGDPSRGRQGASGAQGGRGAQLVFFVRPKGAEKLEIDTSGGMGGHGGAGGPGQVLRSPTGELQRCPGGTPGTSGAPGPAGAVTFLDATVKTAP